MIDQIKGFPKDNEGSSYSSPGAVGSVQPMVEHGSEHERYRGAWDKAALTRASQLMTQPSAIFDSVDVSKKGLKSQTVEPLGRCGTSASFHTRGTLHSGKEMFKMSATGAARISANYLKAQLGKS